MNSMSKTDDMVFHTFTYDLFDHLYKSIVALILKYGIPTWVPAHLYDISCSHKSDRRVRPHPTSRLNFAGLCEMYKYTHGMYKTEAGELFGLNSGTTRDHALQFRKDRFHIEVRKKKIFNRVLQGSFY